MVNLVEETHVIAMALRANIKRALGSKYPQGYQVIGSNAEPGKWWAIIRTPNGAKVRYESVRGKISGPLGV